MNVHRLSASFRGALRPLVLLLALAAGAQPVRAQAPTAQTAPPAPGSVTVTGQVVDAASGQPIVGARVDLGQLARRAVTDAQGRFVVEGVMPGTYAALARQIGYEAQHENVAVGASGGEVVFRMKADPILLQGLVVQGDRFASRRRSAPVTVRAFDRAMLTGAAGRDANTLIRDRAGLNVHPCPGGGGRGTECVRVRGYPYRVRVYLDEAPLPTGLEGLKDFPADELYLVEIYAGGAMIRAYTVTFMESAARRNVRPEPLF